MASSDPNRRIIQYNFYINDSRWGRMFVRICPYLPFVCLNQHRWLANRMRQESLAFKQCGNAFLACSAPGRLQQIVDSLDPSDLVTCGQKRQIETFNKGRWAIGMKQRLAFDSLEMRAALWRTRLRRTKATA